MVEFPLPEPIADDPEDAFATVVALRLTAERLERKAVLTALHRGWSWSRIAQALGISKQAAHKRLAAVATPSTSEKR